MRFEVTAKDLWPSSFETLREAMEHGRFLRDEYGVDVAIHDNTSGDLLINIEA